MEFLSISNRDVLFNPLKCPWYTYPTPTYNTAPLRAQLVKNPLQCRRPQFNFWVRKIPWRKDRLPTLVFLGFSCGSTGKESVLQCRRPGFNLWVGKIPWRRERLPTPVFWPGEFHGLYSLWGRKELDRTEWLSLSLFFTPTYKQCENN